MLVLLVPSYNECKYSWLCVDSLACTLCITCHLYISCRLMKFCNEYTRNVYVTLLFLSRGGCSDRQYSQAICVIHRSITYVTLARLQSTL